MELLNLGNNITNVRQYKRDKNQLEMVKTAIGFVRKDRNRKHETQIYRRWKEVEIWKASLGAPVTSVICLDWFFFVTIRIFPISLTVSQ